MKKTLLIGIGAMLFFLSGCASSESYVLRDYPWHEVERVAVSDVTGVRYSGVKNQLSDILAMQLLKRGYRVIDRQQIDRVLEEKKFQGRDISDADDVRRMGKILGVDAIVIINVGHLSNEKISLTVKMLDVKDGTLIWGGKGDGQKSSGFTALLGAAAGVVLGKKAGGTGGAIIGGIVGGAAGKELAPEIETQAESILEEMVKKLPAR